MLTFVLSVCLIMNSDLISVQWCCIGLWTAQTSSGRLTHADVLLFNVGISDNLDRANKVFCGRANETRLFRGLRCLPREVIVSEKERAIIYFNTASNIMHCQNSINGVFNNNNNKKMGLLHLHNLVLKLQIDRHISTTKMSNTKKQVIHD